MISKKTEIEVKVRVASLAALRKKLLLLGATRQCPRLLERNLVFDSPKRELKEQGILLRLRRSGKQCVLTLKGPAGNHPAYKVREETETEVADFAAVEDILRGIGFLPVFTYEKYREVLRLDRAQVMLDETPIGCFIEIEGAPAAIEAIAADLGFSREDYIRNSYYSLFLLSGGTGDMVFPR